MLSYPLSYAQFLGALRVEEATGKSKTVFFSGDSCGWSATSVVDEWLSYVVHAKYRPACAPRSRPS